MYLGADLGGSAVKLVCLDEKGNIAAARKYDTDRDVSHFERELEGLMAAGCGGSIPETLYLTGVGAGILPETVCGMRTRFCSEFECFGRGGCALAGTDDTLVVSMGTGTAFVRAEKGVYTHIGGSGVGGGTLCGLSALLLGTDDIKEIKALISEGDRTGVDLTIGDISVGDSTGLASDLTAANFGKKLKSAPREDIASGLMNLVCETAAVMAAFVCRGEGLRQAVFVGSVADMPEGFDFIHNVGGLHGIEFIVPPMGAYAGALGAALSEKVKS
ncbi:MAG: hypothetical protein II714_00415 [Oscillospiraceae bacterium]|nr:hypothetical protein [Oscillospiraceae bacterium]